MKDARFRLERLRAKRLAEDDRLVCMERAQILLATREKYVDMSPTVRQAAIIRDLCTQITPVIEPEDIIVGRMPEVMPTCEDEKFIAEHSELFTAPGVPGWLDSMSIYVPDWDWLLRVGVGGIASEARDHLETLGQCDKENEARREFLIAGIQALEAVSALAHRYADEARRIPGIEKSAERQRELEEIATRCDRVAWQAPTDFMEALQLIQLVHKVLSCLVGGRDVTPGRLDQYLLRFYRRDIAERNLNRDDAAALLAMFFLRLSQMAGNGTDFDDNTRRSPCTYTHLYVTVGGVNRDGQSAVNELSFAVLDAIRLLNYKEPTLLARYHRGIDRGFMSKVAGLIKDRLPVTIYNDEVVISALMSQGVDIEDARDYAHSACHNVIVAGNEAGSGPGGFHSFPRLILLAMNGGRDLESGRLSGAKTPKSNEIETFEQFWSALRAQVRFLLENARRASERRWREQLEDSCPLLQSCLMKYSMAQQRPCWQAAGVSHLNHYLMGLATSVDSALAIRRLVFEEKSMRLGELVEIIASDWSGHELLRERIRNQFPRYGQDNPEQRELASKICRMWVEEVESVSRGMERFEMWPGFYSHEVHVHEGARTPATPDGRRSGESLSENLSPSFGTPRCSTTSILRAMAALPFDHTPSGAATLSLTMSNAEAGNESLLPLIESYFNLGGLHIQINVLDPETLRAAVHEPEHYRDLMVRVTGFSAYFTSLSRNVQEDIVRRYQAGN